MAAANLLQLLAKGEDSRHQFKRDTSNADVRGNQFSAVIARPQAEWESTPPPVTLPVTPPVTPPVVTLLELLTSAGDLGNADLREHLQLKDRTHVRERYIDPALAQGLIEMTIPDKPRSRLQKYRLTAAGRTLLQSLHKEPPTP